MNEENCMDWKRKYSIWSTYRFVYGMLWKYGKKILAVGTGKILTNVGAQVMGVVDLRQYFGQKKLKDYADFFSSSSSLCCGVI